MSIDPSKTHYNSELQTISDTTESINFNVQKRDECISSYKDHNCISMNKQNTTTKSVEKTLSFINKDINTTWNKICNFFSKLFNQKNCKNFDKLESCLNNLQNKLETNRISTNDEFLIELGNVISRFTGTTKIDDIKAQLEQLSGNKIPDDISTIIDSAVEKYNSKLLNDIESLNNLLEECEFETDAIKYKKQILAQGQELLSLLEIEPEDILKNGPNQYIQSKFCDNITENEIKSVGRALIDASLDTYNDQFPGVDTVYLTQIDNIKINTKDSGNYVNLLINSYKTYSKDLESSNELEFVWLSEQLCKTIDLIKKDLHEYFGSNGKISIDGQDYQHDQAQFMNSLRTLQVFVEKYNLSSEFNKYLQKY